LGKTGLSPVEHERGGQPGDDVRLGSALARIIGRDAGLREEDVEALANRRDRTLGYRPDFEDFASEDPVTSTRVY
jgi:hypothetical protein